MNEPVFMANSSDPGMQLAVKMAQKTFRVFWREVSWEHRRIVPGLDLACVKAAFSDTGDVENAEDVEQMWINEIQFDGKTIFGTLVNEPNWLKTIAQGDSVQLKLPEVMDWMYAIAGDVYGGFTVNHIRSQMGGGERKHHDAAWGLNFGDPEQPRLVPPDYIGQATPGFFGRLLGSKPEPQDQAKVAATEHPMAVSMAESLKEFAKDPQNLAATDDYGFTALHQQCLAGAAGGVNVLLNHGADGLAPASNGMTPYQLAKRLSWKNVLRVLEKHGITS